MMKLLIVDDDQDMAEGLAEALELSGNRVDVAFTGQAGVAAAASGDYDAVVMDLRLPDLTGIEGLLQIVRAKPAIRCFLITGDCRAQVDEQECGIEGLEILTKPFDPRYLLQRLAAI
jgi:two-component system OmpR family response regulator